MRIEICPTCAETGFLDGVPCCECGGWGSFLVDDNPYWTIRPPHPADVPPWVERKLRKGRVPFDRLRSLNAPRRETKPISEWSYLAVVNEELWGDDDWNSGRAHGQVFMPLWAVISRS